MATIKQKIKDADQIIEEQVELIDEQLERVERMLAPYEQLKEKANRLRAARRALLGGSRTTGGGTTQVRQEDIVSFLNENPGSNPGVIAKAMGVPQPNISSHLYRGKDERFLTDGNKRWWNRDPKNGLNTADDLPEED